MKTIKFIRSCLKLLFRGRDDIFLLVGMFVSVIVFLNVSVFLYRMRTENEVYGFYKNEIKTFAMEQGAGDAKMHAKKFQALLKGLTEISAGNVTCVFSVPRPDSLENQKITLILKKSEPIPFIKGNEYMNTKNGVYIGEELSVRTFRKGNVEFLKLLGTEFQVMDVLPNKMSGGVDDSLYVFWDNLEETVREKLILRITDNRILNVSLQSQKALTDAYHEYQNLAGSLGFMLNVTDARSGESVENVWYRYYNAVFLTCGLIFSLLSCLGTGYYWVKNSRRDIAIMRACGFGWRHLGACLTWKIAGMGAVAFLVASFFEAVYLILLDDMPPKAGFFLVLFWTALMVTLLVCAETGSMMVRAKKMSVDEMLRDE